MELIAEGIHVMESLSNEESLISGELKRISVYHQNNQLNIDLNIKLLYSKKYDEIILKLVNVSEYSLNYNSSNNFYFIEEYKFFNNDGDIYLSLDPVNGSDYVDTNDNDFIKAKSVCLYSQPIVGLQTGETTNTATSGLF
jgi:aspartate-semialdehyde dehydrogenase